MKNPDFDLIADILRLRIEAAEFPAQRIFLRHTMQVFSEVLRGSCPSFDEIRFNTRCGMEQLNVEEPFRMPPRRRPPPLPPVQDPVGAIVRRPTNVWADDPYAHIVQAPTPPNVPAQQANPTPAAGYGLPAAQQAVAGQVTSAERHNQHLRAMVMMEGAVSMGLVPAPQAPQAPWRTRGLTQIENYNRADLAVPGGVVEGDFLHTDDYVEGAAEAFFEEPTEEAEGDAGE